MADEPLEELEEDLQPQDTWPHYPPVVVPTDTIARLFDSLSTYAGCQRDFVDRSELSELTLRELGCDVACALAELVDNLGGCAQARQDRVRDVLLGLINGVVDGSRRYVIKRSEVH